MMPDPPQASVWLDVPEDCRMRGEFTGDRDIHVMFGNPDDGVNVLFERPALERFVEMANELLAVPLPDDLKAELPVVVSSAA